MIYCSVSTLYCWIKQIILGQNIRHGYLSDCLLVVFSHITDRGCGHE